MFETVAIGWKVRGCDVSSSIVRLWKDLGPEPDDGNRGIGFEKSGGSDMAPPISKVCGSDWSRCFFRHLLQQKITATMIIKEPATPDATDIPITAPGLME